MNCCPITYLQCSGIYSEKGLKLLSRNLKGLNRLDFSSTELRQEAALRADKISIQGVQPKLSAQLSIREQRFKLVDQNGHYILKPQLPDYPQVPENEDVTMRLAQLAGIDVPLHGLLYGKDNQLTYFIRRFDRTLRNEKVHTEDFAQLAGKTRDTKYRSSMEQVAKLIDDYCTFPAVEKAKLFQMTLFSFLVGNEDMHLKNFSVIRKGELITLSPAYDLVNTTIVLQNAVEEMALPLNGKKNRISRRDIVDYFGSQRLHLADKVISRILTNFIRNKQEYLEVIRKSFLADIIKEKYIQLLIDRFNIIFP